MLVAIRSFISNDPYGEIRVIRGRTHIAEDSDLAVQFPDAFRPAAGPRGPRERVSGAVGTASLLSRRSAPPASPRGLEPWRIQTHADQCRLVERPSPARLRLSATAREDLIEVMRSTTELDGLEVGGLLFGSTHGDLVEVLRATGPGPEAHRGPSSFGFDLKYNERMTTEMGAAGFACTGEWHSHPSSTGTPSPDDLGLFSLRRARLGLSLYVAVLAVPVRSGWQMVPWIVRPSFAGDVCEPGRFRT